MTGDYIISEGLSPSENILKEFVLFLNSLYRLIDRIAGYLGLVIAVPLFTVLAFILWVSLKYMNRSLRRNIRKFFEAIDTENVRSLILMHRSIHLRRTSTDEMLSKSSASKDFFLIKPLLTQIRITSNLLLEAENRLHKTVYPDLQRPLSEDQIQKLREHAEQLTNIWEPDDFVRLG
jgi:hypothetical protein